MLLEEITPAHCYADKRKRDHRVRRQSNFARDLGCLLRGVRHCRSPSRQDVTPRELADVPHICLCYLATGKALFQDVQGVGELFPWGLHRLV